jgi:1-acyl-sn-glycerol-3-phosphate acyltransferase
MIDRETDAAPRGPPPRLRAGRPQDAVRLLGWGQWLLRWQLRKLARLPTSASPALVFRAQRAAASSVLAHLQVRLQVSGLEHLPGSPGLVLALHEGLADAACLATLPLPLRFVARRELFDWDRIGPALRGCGHIAIEPERGAAAYRSLVRAAGHALAEGESVVVFPQGCVLGIETAFLPGAFHLARRLAAPILPVVITGSHRIWEHPFSPRLRYAQPVAMQILPRISAATTRDCDPERLRLELQRQMKRTALAPDCPAPRHYLPARDGEWPGFRFELDPDFDCR